MSFGGMMSVLVIIVMLSATTVYLVVRDDPIAPLVGACVGGLISVVAFQRLRPP